jgi:eukaryotic-like serine/threonine-protein kinase
MFVGQKVGPFEIEKELGSGAMGQVYKARYDQDGKQMVVALKIVALGLLGNEGAMARFEREASILKQLKHPHIVRLRATGKFGKNAQAAPFIAMEFVDGEPLDRVLTRRGRLGWEEVLTYAKQLCSALQYAHDKGIIHRDLKPSNLMITKDGVLKLTDFGIAKDTDVTQLTAQNSTIGTAAYMSPEQCRGERNLSAKSDLYSLGVVLFELITGRKPFSSDTTVDMFLKHVNEKPPRPSRFIPDLPVWMDNLIMFLLEKDRETRPMDAATVKRMLEDIETKVQTQTSAGAELANARRVDRPTHSDDLDENDLEAAKAIRQATTGKKPKKKKVVPLLQRQWVRALPLFGFLLVLAGGGVYLLMPGKAPDYSESLTQLKNAKTFQEKYELADALLKRTGLPDDVLAEAKRIRREARGERLESVLAKRFKNRVGGLKFDKAQENEDEKAYDAAWSALEAEEKGDLKKADEQWAKIKVREDEIADQYTSGWGWLAENHLGILKKVETTVSELRETLQQDEINEKPWKYDAKEPEAVARYAVRLGMLPELKIEMPGQIQRVVDMPKARRMFAELVEVSRDKPEHRLWYLLGIRERGTNFDPKSDDPTKRLEKVRKMLTEAKALWLTAKPDPDASLARRTCRIRVRDVIELYGDESDSSFKELVDEAKKLASEMMPK